MLYDFTKFIGLSRIEAVGLIARAGRSILVDSTKDASVFQPADYKIFIDYEDDIVIGVRFSNE